MRDARTLSRDVLAAAIPYVDRIPLAAGTTVFVTQALGGSCTAVTDMGYMVRIEGKDADAIGAEPPEVPSAEALSSKSLEELAWDQLKTCYDPETSQRAKISTASTNMIACRAFIPGIQLTGSVRHPVEKRYPDGG